MLFSILFCQEQLLCTWPKVLTWDEAVAEWTKMESDLLTSGILSCKIAGELYLRISTEIDFNYRNTSERSNELEAVIKSIKNPIQDQLQDELSHLGIGLNKFGEIDTNIVTDMKGILKNAAGAPEQGIADLAQTIPDFKAMVDSLKPEEVEEDEDLADEDNVELEDNGEPARKKQKGADGDEKWYARDRYLLSCERNIETLISTAVDLVKPVYNDLCKHCDAVAAGPIAMQELFSREQILAMTCKEGCRLVLEGSEEELKTFKARFDVSSKATVSSGSAGDGGKLHNLSSSPPCATVADLVRFEDLKSGLAARLDTAINQKSDFANFRKDISKKLNPVKELVREAKLRVNGMVSRKGNYNSMKKVVKAADGAPAPTIPILGLEAEDNVVVVAPCRLEAYVSTPFGKEWLMKGMDKPAVLTGFSDLICKPESKMAVAMSKFQETMAKELAGKTPASRYSDELQIDVLDEAREDLKAALAKSGIPLNVMEKAGPWIGPMGPPAGIQSLVCQIFGIAPQVEVTSAEKQYAGSIKMNVFGIRRFAMTPLVQWLNYQRAGPTAAASGSASLSEVKQTDMKKVRAGFRNMDAETLRSFTGTAGGTVYFGTVSAGQVLVTPPGFLTTEVSGTERNISLKLGYVHVSSHDTLQQLYQDVQWCGVAEDKNLKATCDFLLKMELSCKQDPTQSSYMDFCTYINTCLNMYVC